MSTAKINFNTDEHCSYRVCPNLTLHFQFIEDSVAHMYFTNDEDYYVNVPENIVVYKYSDIENKIIKGEIEVTFPKRIQLPNISRAIITYTTTYYTLNTMRKYDICYDNTVVLSIEPQYCWKFVNYKLTDYKKL
jgi:hypothetical protein